LRLLNDAKTPPFLPTETVTANEDLRLKYRYIDLRRGPLQNNIELRHKVALAIRNHLSSRGFFEIETPFMTRSTPEGARDYLVPSRVYPGQFYALPQSPQLFKQILMISGFDRYFQIVRCFRDEDLRADRQPEFTQIDLEMSYPQQERVFEVVEGFLTAAWDAAGAKISAPFPRMTYDEAMRLYGIDKPDLRLPALCDVRDLLTSESKQTLALDAELPIVAVRIPKVGEVSRKERDENKLLFSKTHGPKLLDDMKRLEKSWPDAVAAIRKRCNAAPEDFLAIVASGVAEDRSALKLRAAERAVYTSAGAFRLEIARKYAVRHKAFDGDPKSADSYRFLWVTDFPMFEWDDGEQRWQAAHHPFTSPRDQDMDKLESDPGAVRALAYDVVLNGTELGSGSIRIHRQDIQSLIFKALGMSEEEARSRFGFFLEALQYGTPPHGGIALGLDRIVMILAGADSLREVIPFPKTAYAQDLMVDAPMHVSPAQLEELYLMPAFYGLSPENRKLLKTCDLVLDFLHKELFGRDFPQDTPLQAATALIFAKTFGDAEAIVRLARAGYGAQAAGLCRSILESAVNIRFITEKDSAARALAFLKSASPDIQRLATKLRRSSSQAEVIAVFEKAQQLGRESLWPPNVKDRMQALHPGELHTYDLLYSMFSQVIHSSVSSLAGVYTESQKAARITLPPTNQDIELPLMIVLDFTRVVAVETFNVFGLDFSTLGAIYDEFQKQRAHLQ
ncbi:MAG: aspartate--tRNA ligase, partial [Terriglobales bacterium]